MDAPRREPPKRALTDRSNTAARASAAGCAPMDVPLVPTRATSAGRSEKEEMHAALLRHRTLQLQARLREEAELAAGAATELGDLGGAPQRAGGAMPQSARPPLPPRRTSTAAAAPRGAGAPSPRGTAAPPPSAELLAAFCGHASDHKPRSYTPFDWMEVWGTQLRGIVLAAGGRVWKRSGEGDSADGGSGSAGDAALRDAGGGDSPRTPPAAEAPAPGGSGRRES